MDEFGEEAFDRAVLQGMEGDDGDAGGGTEPVGIGIAPGDLLGGVADGGEEGFEATEFVVDGDAESLEGLGGGVDAPGATPEGGLHQIGEGRRGEERCGFASTDDGGGDATGGGFFGVVAEDGGEFGFAALVHEVGRGEGSGGVEAHVEGAFAHEGEAAGGVVHLVGGEAEIGEKHVGGEPGVAHLARKVGKVALERVDAGAGSSGGLDVGGGVGEVRGVGVVEDDGARGVGRGVIGRPCDGRVARCHFRGDGGGVASEAGGAVGVGLARARGEGGEALAPEDGDVGGGVQPATLAVGEREETCVYLEKRVDKGEEDGECGGTGFWSVQNPSIDR